MSKHVVTSREYSMNSKSNGILTGLLFVIFGLVTAVCGQGVLNLIILFVGIVIVAYGAEVYLSTRSLEGSLVMIILGLLFAILGFYGFAAEIIRVLFGLLIVIIGLMIAVGSQVSVLGFKLPEGRDNIVNLCIGLIFIILGIVAMLNLGGSFSMLIRVIGIVICILGVVKIAKVSGIIKN